MKLPQEDYVVETATKRIHEHCEREECARNPGRPFTAWEELHPETRAALMRAVTTGAHTVARGLLLDLREWMERQGDIGAAYVRALTRYAAEEVDYRFEFEATREALSHDDHTREIENALRGVAHIGFDPARQKRQA